MTKIPVFAAICLVLVTAGCQSPSRKSSTTLVGVAETVITPPDPAGYAMWGYDRKGKLSTGTHDDLHTRALFVQDKDSNAALLLTVAVLNMDESVMDLIRRGIQEQTGIPFEHILVSSTHTHSGPVIGTPDSIAQRFLRARADAGAPTGDHRNRDSAYLAFFISQNVDCGVGAWRKREPGRIGTGKTEIFGLAMNDRRMAHGGWAPDSMAAVIKVEDAAGKLKGVFVNYGCHPSALDLHNLEFTEDWPYYTIKAIKEKTGGDVVVGYIQSAQGDAKVGYMAELSAVGADMNGIRSFRFAEKKGRILGDAVSTLLDSISTSGDLAVKAVYEKFPFPRRTTYPYTYAEALRWKAAAYKKLAEAEKQVGITVGRRQFDFYKVDCWLADQAVNVSQAVEANPHPEPVMMAMQGLRIGDNYFVTFPNEVFTEIGLGVKKASPHPNTFVIGVAGGHMGYIPTKAEFLEQGYAANGSPFSPDCEEVLLKASAKLIGALDGQ